MEEEYIIDKSVGCVIINKDWTKVLIIKTDDNYGFPKGHMELGENELMTMRREVSEEIGIQLSHEKILGRFEISFPIYNKNILRIIVCYMIKYDDKIPLTVQLGEIDQAMWVTWKEAINLLCNSKQYLILLEALKIVIVKKYNFKNIFMKIKNYDKIYVEYQNQPYYSTTANLSLPILKPYIKFYMGCNVLIDMFINDLDLSKVSIYKIKPVYNIYYTVIFPEDNINDLFFLRNNNFTYILNNFNGICIKNFFSTIRYNFGIIWNTDNISKINMQLN